MSLWIRLCNHTYIHTYIKFRSIRQKIGMGRVLHGESSNWDGESVASSGQQWCTRYRWPLLADNGSCKRKATRGNGTVALGPIATTVSIPPEGLHSNDTSTLHRGSFWFISCLSGLCLTMLHAIAMHGFTFVAHELCHVCAHAVAGSMALEVHSGTLHTQTRHRRGHGCLAASSALGRMQPPKCTRLNVYRRPASVGGRTDRGQGEWGAGGEEGGGEGGMVVGVES